MENEVLQWNRLVWSRTEESKWNRRENNENKLEQRYAGRGWKKVNSIEQSEMAQTMY